jgi:hypothetical protein
MRLRRPSAFVLFSLLALLSLTATAAGQEPTSHRVAAVDVTCPDGGGFAQGADCYRYGEREIPPSLLPPGAPERAVLFGGRLSFRFLGLEPTARYEVRARFLSDSDARVMRCAVAGTEVERELHLPNAQILERRWQVPAATADLQVELTCLAGPNAVVASLEVWSTSPAALRPPPRLADELRRIDVPFPRLTPRPTAVTGIANPRLRLDGSWKFAAAAPADLAHQTAADVAGWPDIEVPGEWVMQGHSVEKGAAAAYRREFTVPDDWRGHPVRLRFDAVHSACTVWLNGEAIGRHEGGFVPFGGK